MHRSGTSCLAGCLERSGLHLGKVCRGGRFNPKGYYELRSLQHLNDQILGLNRGSWYSPPLEVQVHSYHRQQIKEKVHELSGQRPSGVKDPRLLLLLDTWLEPVHPPYTLVGTFRHPLAVVQSLARRNGISEEKGIALWLHYNELLIQQHQEKPFPIIEFDLSDVEGYCRNVAAMGKKLALSPKLSHLRYFVSRDLDHHPVDELRVPEECRQAYAYLQAHGLRFTAKATGAEEDPGYLTEGRSRIIGMIQELAFSTTHINFTESIRMKGRLG